MRRYWKRTCIISGTLKRRHPQDHPGGRTGEAAGQCGHLRHLQPAPPGPAELEALDAAVEAMKAAVENVEYGAFAWDKQRGMFVQIGRPVPVKQLCLNRYQERARNGEIPSGIDPEKFKILERTVAEIAGDWKEAEDE